jgi:hypothetical protein
MRYSGTKVIDDEMERGSRPVEGSTGIDDKADLKIEVLRRALANLEGMVQEIDPMGDRAHPAWATIYMIKALLKGERK